MSEAMERAREEAWKKVWNSLPFLSRNFLCVPRKPEYESWFKAGFHVGYEMGKAEGFGAGQH